MQCRYNMVEIKTDFQVDQSWHGSPISNGKNGLRSKWNWQGLPTSFLALLQFDTDGTSQFQCFCLILCFNNTVIDLNIRTQINTWSNKKIYCKMNFFWCKKTRDWNHVLTAAEWKFQNETGCLLWPKNVKAFQSSFILPTVNTEK